MEMTREQRWDGGARRGAHADRPGWEADDVISARVTEVRGRRCPRLPHLHSTHTVSGAQLSCGGSGGPSHYDWSLLILSAKESKQMRLRFPTASVMNGLSD